MKIHEYQAKELFAQYGIPVEEHILCNRPGELPVAFIKLGATKAVIKAQVLTGGRGKAGGVKRVDNAEEALQKAHEILAIDAKMAFDDNALYRQQQVAGLAEPTPDEQTEMYAHDKGFSYVRMDGEIGCMVNGAGLAMATLDMIKLYGGNPANFLDIGGSSRPQKVIDAMELLLKDPKVKVVLINIFGGITRCDDVARGLLDAFDKIRNPIPVVVRLTDTVTFLVVPGSGSFQYTSEEYL